MPEKANEVESLKRQAEIESMLITGKTRETIVQFCANSYDIKPRQVDKYIAKVKESWVALFNDDRRQNLAEAIKKREKLYEDAIDSGATKTALAIHDSIDKLKGLFIEKIEHSGGISVLTEEQIKAMKKAIPGKGD